MKHLQYILILLLAIVSASCSDDYADISTPPTDGLGQMVLFSSGNTENQTLRATVGKTYYMPDTYRFVCRMYYKAQTGSEFFDISGNTDQTAWLKVSGKVGNSLYWNKNYIELTRDNEGKYIKGPGGVDDYGNDYSATAFYWQNRKEHPFLAWTHLNHATNIVGGVAAGTLKTTADTNYRVYSNEIVQAWELDHYEIYGIAEKFTDQEQMEAYVREHGKESSFKTAQTDLETQKQWSWSNEQYYYRHGKQYKWSRQHAEACNESQTSYDNQWFQEFMYFETIAYEPDHTEQQVMNTQPSKTNIIDYLKKNGIYVAKAELKVNSEGQPLDADNNVTDNPDKYVYTYAKTDEYGNLLYNEDTPEFTFYFSAHYVKKERKKYEDFPCNAFDLTRGKKTSMAQQPDIAQALTLQAPSGATQEANRVNLYFKHQFSQIQVNIMNAADNSVELTKDDILSTELLGVSEEGYVFTDLDDEGNVHSTAYKEIDFSQYTEQQLKDNPYGTSFTMFDLPQDQTATGYLKSFCCLTFGQLQAIRITWKETGDGQTIHKSTFRIPNTELVNLKSGVKYIWNIEVRRGTLAIIRTEIVDWELPEDEIHNGSADGTIQN